MLAVRTNMKKEGKLTKKALQRQQAAERQARQRQKKRNTGQPIEERSIVSARKTKDRNNKRQRGEPIEELSKVSARVTKVQTILNCNDTIPHDIGALPWYELSKF